MSISEHSLVRRAASTVDNELDLMLALSEHVIAELSLDEILPRLCIFAAELIDAELMLVPMLDEDRESYEYAAATGKDADLVVHARFPITTGLCGWVLRNREAVLHGEGHDLPIGDHRVWEPGMHSSLLVPLLSRGEIIGGLSGVGKREGGSFSERDLKLLTLFANHTSVALSNAQAVARERQAKDELLAAKQRAEDQAHELTVVLEVQKRLEDELLHAQKMESMGRLAGGIAHDFNNILMTISGSLELATMELDDLAGALAGGAELDVEPVKVLLDDAGRAATRAASLTQQLLAFARRQVVEPQPTDLGASIDEAASMLARVLPSTIDLRCEVERGLHPVLADPAQLNQILLNLALNARDALPRGGSIEIRARNRSVAAGELSSHDGPVMVGDYVELCVEDDGVGIDSQLIPQLFEPFLTTKSAGKGTGLGLATCYGIVRQLGGAIRVSSALDRGTCFELLFPRAHTSIARPVELAPHSHELAAKTIWVVDDDPAVRDTVCAMLARFGHEVRSSSDGAAALAELSRTDLAIDLLITDVLMPGLDGVELVARLGDRLQGVETLFMSGYPAEHHQDLITQRRQFLRKPFSPQELAQQLLRIFAPS